MSSGASFLFIVPHIKSITERSGDGGGHRTGPFFQSRSRELLMKIVDP